MPDSTIGPYCILEKLGEGAMGVVYRAEDTRLGRIVALKFLPPALQSDPTASARFLQEARAAARIGHPNVCTIYDIHDHDGERFIAMELVDGLTLRQRLHGLAAGGEMMALSEALAHAASIAGALEAAHACGVLHRDIKPENIMIDRSGRLRVMDFGLAHIEQSERLTQARTLVGTVAYMAPECMRNEEADAGSDIFSTGVVLYEMLAGRLPFRGMHEAAMIYSILNQEPEPLSALRNDISEEIEQLVRRALAKDPAGRYRNAGELLVDIHALGPEPLTRRHTPLPKPAPSPVTIAGSGGSPISGSSVGRSPGAGESELRVYLCSTPDDMQEEREHLMKQVFPRIRSLCRERGITFTEIDLNWGSATEESSSGHEIRVRLEEIDRCRPWFIGILGERYGREVEIHEIYSDPGLLEAYPWIEDAATAAVSIVEIEIEYGLLGARSNRSGAHVYLRRQRASLHDDSPPMERDERLDALVRRIVDAGSDVTGYRDPVSLGEMIHDDLVGIIRRDFAHTTARSPLEMERLAHAAFAASRRHSYIPNARYLKRINEFVGTSSGAAPESGAAGDILLVTGESGSGKSSLLSYWAFQCRRRYPDVHLIEHYVGIGAGSAAHTTILRHIMMEIRDLFGRSEEIPATAAEIDSEFPRWLGFASADGAGIRLVVIVDAVEQTAGSGIEWLPRSLPAGVRLIVGCSPGETLETIRARGFAEVAIEPLLVEERESLVVRYLGSYHRTLQPEQIRRIASDPKCALPIFLRTLLEELRLHGRPERIDRMIALYLGASGTEALLQIMLERLEEDFGTRPLRAMMSLLRASKEGLTEAELAELAQLSRQKLSSLVTLLDYHLVRRDGQLTFFHDYLLRAVEQRYLPRGERRREAHLLLAAHFASTPVSWRSTSELVHQLHCAEEWERLAGALSDIDRFLLLVEHGRMFEILVAWKELSAHQIDMEAELLRSLDLIEREIGTDDTAPRSEGDTEREQRHERYSEALGHLAEILAINGRLESAYDLTLRLLTHLEQQHDRLRAGRALQKLGWIMAAMGRYGEALEHYLEARVIFEEIGDGQGIADILGSIGSVHFYLAEYPKALECHEESLRMAEARNDTKRAATAIASIGQVLSIQGEYPRALEYYARHLALCNETADRLAAAMTHNDIGIVYQRMGDYPRAIECFRQQLALASSANDLLKVSQAYGNLGIVHHLQGDDDRAIEFHERQIVIARERGDPLGMSRAILNMGNIHFTRGDYPRALKCFEQRREIASKLGDRQGYSIAMGNIGALHAQLGDPRGALACLDVALSEHRAIGFLHGVTFWLEERARILLELAIDEPEMPAYLPAHLPDATPGSWRPIALATAAGHARECHEISGKLQKRDTLFSSRVMLAVLDSIAGNHAAAAELTGMLEQECSDTQRAELHYWLWRLPSSGSASKIDHRGEALRLYRQSAGVSAGGRFGRRIDELRGNGEGAEARE